jgi:hypothetical protein
MDIDSYQPLKTVKKAALPAFIIIILNIALSFAKQYGVVLDESVVWELALAGYGALLALINWIKNHKKGKAASI